MNKEIFSDLYVRNVDQDLIFEHKKEDKKIPICTIPLTDWVEAIEHLNQPAEQGSSGNG